MLKRADLTIPNLLSLSRIAFLPLLFWLVEREDKTAFVIAFVAIASTDFLDGFIARRFNMKSELGNKLDTLADLPFYIACAWFAWILFPDLVRAHMGMLYGVFGMLAASFVAGLIRQGRFVMIHTHILRFNAWLVFLLVLLHFVMDITWLLRVTLFIYYIGFLEEIVMFILDPKVDPDTRSLWWILKRRRNVAADS